MTKTDAAVQTLSDINPDVVLEVSITGNFSSEFIVNVTFLSVLSFHLQSRS